MTFLSSHDRQLIEYSCLQHTAGQAASIIHFPICLFERGSTQKDLHSLIVMYYQTDNKDFVLGTGQGCHLNRLKNSL